MKNKASTFLKQIISFLSSIAKAKPSMAIKTKTNALKARLMVLSLMKNKKVLLGSITAKIHTILARPENDEEDLNKAVVLYTGAMSNESNSQFLNDEADDVKFPDLRLSLSNEEEFEFDDPGGSIIEMVKNSKEHNGDDFRLEDEIDHAADLFITRFYKRVRLEKLESFERLQGMLARGN